MKLKRYHFEKTFKKIKSHKKFYRLAQGTSKSLRCRANPHSRMVPWLQGGSSRRFEPYTKKQSLCTQELRSAYPRS